MHGGALKIVCVDQEPLAGLRSPAYCRVVCRRHLMSSQAGLKPQHLWVAAGRHRGRACQRLTPRSDACTRLQVINCVAWRGGGVG